MTQRKRLTVLGTSVSILFVLAHDFWAWEQPIPLGPAGVPGWIFVFCGLQFALAAVIYWYGRYANTTAEVDDDDSTAPGS